MTQFLPNDAPPDLEEPPTHEREYFRKGGPQGELGWKVTLAGRPAIRMDRGDRLQLEQWNNGLGWTPSDRFRPLTRPQMAQIAFAADKMLCTHLGLHAKARKQWGGLKGHEVAGWIKEGPRSPRVRQKLYQVIIGVLEAEL